VHQNCTLDEDTRPIRRTRGGLGSGLDIILPRNTWVNVPVEEPFAKGSSFVIDKVAGQYSLWREAEPLCKIGLPPRPAWYDTPTASGKRIGGIGVMQGTYFAVYPSELCGFWKTEPKRNCRFCSVGLCHGKTESGEKSVQDVVDAVKLARKHERITFVHFNTGFHEDDKALDVIIPYVEAVKRETGLLVGVQCPPAADLSRYDLLKKAGADHVSFCFEIFDPDRFPDICPGKAEAFGRIAETLGNDALLREAAHAATAYLKGKRPHPGQLVFYRALMHCVKLWGKGPVAGEIIAGLEDPESSIAAISFLAGRGAVSTVCVFRPCIGTGLENEPPPDAAAIASVFARMYCACIEKGIPFGIAPNIRTAMVHLPEEGKWLSSCELGVRVWTHAAKCAGMKAAFRAMCALKRKT